jgi:hypothetical protein
MAVAQEGSFGAQLRKLRERLASRKRSLLRGLDSVPPPSAP